MFSFFTKIDRILFPKSPARQISSVDSSVNCTGSDRSLFTEFHCTIRIPRDKKLCVPPTPSYSRHHKQRHPGVTCFTKRQERFSRLEITGLLYSFLAFQIRNYRHSIQLHALELQIGSLDFIMVRSVHDPSFEGDQIGSPTLLLPLLLRLLLPLLLLLPLHRSVRMDRGHWA